MASRPRRRGSAKKIILGLAFAILPALLFYVALQTGAAAAFADWFGNLVASNYSGN